LVVPQTVLNESYAREIFDGLAAEGVKVRHFVLHVEKGELIRRIHGDEEEAGAREWRLGHVERYERALAWLREAGTVVDTTRLEPDGVVEEILGGI
jgi:hypothetical protein